MGVCFVNISRCSSERGPAGFGGWRFFRRGDSRVTMLTRGSARGDKVYFDAGPGNRISGTLKAWEEGYVAVVETDLADRGLRQYPGFPEIGAIFRVPVRLEE